jgi:hypothetical protein
MLARIEEAKVTGSLCLARTELRNRLKRHGRSAFGADAQIITADVTHKEAA